MLLPFYATLMLLFDAHPHETNSAIANLQVIATFVGVDGSPSTPEIQITMHETN